MRVKAVIDVNSETEIAAWTCEQVVLLAAAQVRLTSDVINHKYSDIDLNISKIRPFSGLCVEAEVRLTKV